MDIATSTRLRRERCIVCILGVRRIEYYLSCYLFMSLHRKTQCVAYMYWLYILL